jgi:60 kDa SS-A/Ro ribonucleoprotein
VLGYRLENAIQRVTCPQNVFAHKNGPKEETMKYLKNVASKPGATATPQSEPILGSAQVANSAGGYAWAVDDWTRLRRFLILGSEGGSYYASERTLSAENASGVLRCIEADGARVVREVVQISASGRAPKNDPALFVLALATAGGDEATRKAAFDALPQVARTGTHLMHFAAYVEASRGWGRGLRRAVGNWYNGKRARDVAFQALKYQARDGWSHRDLLRLSHPQPVSESHRTIYHWITQGWDWVGEEPHPDDAVVQLWAFERIKRASTPAEAASLIRGYRLPREAVPTPFLSEKIVWEALLESTPMTALIRNLATLTRIGLLEVGSETTKRVIAQITDSAWLRKARVHPIGVLTALMTYSAGRGMRGQHTWTPVPQVVDALDAAFYKAFENVETTRKRWLLALDVSGSMTCGAVAGVPNLTPRAASAAMALVTAATEPHYQAVGFTSGASGYGGPWGGGASALTPLAISPRQRLDDVIKATDNLPFGGTDCALPMLWALENKKEFDVFVVYTDSETWAGAVHPTQALQQYRDATGIAAKLIVVGMVSNGFSIADPNDAGMLDVVGFDASTPQLMADFARGDV